MTEGEAMGDEPEEGLVFHEGTRLTDLKIKQNLSIDYPRLEPLHHLKIEWMFQFYKIRSTWNNGHWITLAVGCLAVIFSGWDFGIGELASGGDYYSVGINPSDEDSGFRNLPAAPFILTLMTLGLWAIFLLRLWSIYPLMRSQAVSMYVALLAAEFSQFWAHGYDPQFPFGYVGFAFAVALVGLILVIFVCFILQRAVIETRDLHVEEKHWHPDPRQVDIAMRDHSLLAWSVGLISYCVLVIIHSWAGAHYVAVRQPDAITGWWLLKFIHLISGLIMVWLIMVVLWYPQIMLGSADITIESDRSRQVGRTQSSEKKSAQPSRPGKCPDCGAETPVKMRANGEISAACAIDGCNGSATPGEKCSVCGTRISSRIICLACNCSAPVGNHFSDDEAW